MDNYTTRDLESALTERCGRPVRVSGCPDTSLRIVLDPIGDRGRVELLATGSGLRWTVTDRGAVGSLYDLDLDFVIEKLREFDTALTRCGAELVADTDDRSLARPWQRSSTVSSSCRYWPACSPTTAPPDRNLTRLGNRSVLP